jgi:hypothetical protein
MRGRPAQRPRHGCASQTRAFLLLPDRLPLPSEAANLTGPAMGNDTIGGTTAAARNLICSRE